VEVREEDSWSDVADKWSVSSSGNVNFPQQALGKFICQPYTAFSSLTIGEEPCLSKPSHAEQWLNWKRLVSKERAESDSLNVLAGITLVLQGDTFGANPSCAVRLTDSLKQNGETGALFHKCLYVKQIFY